VKLHLVRRVSVEIRRSGQHAGNQEPVSISETSERQTRAPLSMLRK